MSIPVSVLQLIKGKPATDPKELQRFLDLDLVGNLMINSKWDFTEKEREALSPGNQLVLVLQNIGINHVDATSLAEILERLGILYECNKAPLQFPNDSISDLKSIHARLQEWIRRGWMMETNLAEVSDQDFRTKTMQAERVEMEEARAQLDKSLSELEKKFTAAVARVHTYVKELVQ